MNPVVILVRNNRALTQKTVQSALAQDIPVSILALDNASSDGVSQWLRTQPVQVITFTPQIGVSSGWNAALRWIFDIRKHEHCLVLNNDVYLSPWTYRRLLAEPEGMVTAVGVDSMEKLHATEPGEVSKRLHPDFSCFLLRRSTWESVGPFDAGMVHYASDADWHIRMHQQGIEAVCLDIPYFHYASGTLKSASPEERESICKQADLDRAAFKEKWGCEVGSPEYNAMFRTAKSAS